MRFCISTLCLRSIHRLVGLGTFLFSSTVKTPCINGSFIPSFFGCFRKITTSQQSSATWISSTWWHTTCTGRGSVRPTTTRRCSDVPGTKTIATSTTASTTGLPRACRHGRSTWVFRCTVGHGSWRRTTFPTFRRRPRELVRPVRSPKRPVFWPISKSVA